MQPPTRSTQRESGHDVNRMYGEAILSGDLDFGDPDLPTTAQARRLTRNPPGELIETTLGNELTLTNRDPNYNRLSGQHVVFLMINGERRPL